MLVDFVDPTLRCMVPWVGFDLDSRLGWCCDKEVLGAIPSEVALRWAREGAGIWLALLEVIRLGDRFRTPCCWLCVAVLVDFVCCGMMDCRMIPGLWFVEGAGIWVARLARLLWLIEVLSDTLADNFLCCCCLRRIVLSAIGMVERENAEVVVDWLPKDDVEVDSVGRMDGRRWYVMVDCELILVSLLKLLDLWTGDFGETGKEGRCKWTEEGEWSGVSIIIVIYIKRDKLGDLPYCIGEGIFNVFIKPYKVKLKTMFSFV